MALLCSQGRAMRAYQNNMFICADTAITLKKRADYHLLNLGSFQCAWAVACVTQNCTLIRDGMACRIENPSSQLLRLDFVNLCVH